MIQVHKIMKTNLFPKGRKEWVIAFVSIFVLSIPIIIIIRTYSIQINHRLVGSFPAMFVDKCSKKCLDSLPEKLSVLSDGYIQAFYIQSTESHVFFPFGYVANKEFCSNSFNDSIGQRIEYLGKEIRTSKSGIGFPMKTRMMYYCMQEGNDGSWLMTENNLSLFKEYLKYESAMKGFVQCKEQRGCFSR